MQNLNQNSFPAAQVTATNTALTSLENIYEPVAPNLTPDQREKMPKINVDNKAFVEDASNVLGMPAASAIIPPYIRKGDIDIDLLTFEQVDAVIIRMERLLGVLQDIRIVAGSEAYVTSLVVKKMVDAAAVAGINGADELSRKLGQRFAANGNRGNSGGGTTPTP